MDVTRHEPGSFSWAELGTSDAEAAKRFYTGLFGWTFVDSPAGPGMIYTMLKKRGKSVGALYKMGPEPKGAPPHWTTYVTVASADESARKAKGLGARVLAEPFDVMDVGRMATIQDPQGAVLCVWQPRKNIGAEVLNEPNAMCWCELDTNDTKGAVPFYTGLFGWGTKGGGEYTEWQRNGVSIGGLMKIPKEWGPVPPSWLIYFEVEDCNRTAARAKELGGGTVVDPTDVGEVGRWAVVRDPQGAVFAVIQPKKR